MGDSDDLLARLQHLGGLPQTRGGLDQDLHQLAAQAAKILHADNCSVMLLGEGEFEQLRLRVCASFGPLPAKAYRQETAKGEGISGHVLASGKSLLVEDIAQSPFAQLARRPDDPRKSMIASPLTIDGNIIGVINASGPKGRKRFTLDDLNLLDIVALFVTKSIQVIQLQNILNSRFAQIALARDADRTIGEVMVGAAHNPDQLAKILAKSFYREMTRAGFGSNQIIGAASEIISQLSKGLQKHRKRMETGTRNAPPDGADTGPSPGSPKAR